MAELKCDKCDREFDEHQIVEHPGMVRVYHNKIICEDCLIDMGVSIDEATPYETYVDWKLQSGGPDGGWI